MMARVTRVIQQLYTVSSVSVGKEEIASALIDF